MAASYVGSGAWTAGTGDITPAMPSGWAIGDTIILFMASKYDDATLTTDLVSLGWTDWGVIFNTGRPTGNDNGNLRARVFTKVAASGETIPTLSFASNNVSVAHTTAYRPAVGNILTIEGEMVKDDTIGAAAFVCSSSLGITQGKIAHVDYAINTDLAVPGAGTFSTSGMSWSAPVNNTAAFATTAGTDASAISNRATPLNGSTSSPIQYDLGLSGNATNVVAVGFIAVIGDMAPPPPSTAPVLSGTAGDAAITLNWTSATGANWYEVEENGGIVDGTDALTLGRSGLTNGTTYTYRVRGTNDFGVGPWSNSLQLTPVAPTPPAAPTLTVVAGSTGSRADLSWSALGDADTYDIERDGVIVQTGLSASAIGTSVSDGPLVGSTLYSYRVRGVNAVGVGAWSTTQTVTTAAATGVSISEDFSSFALGVDAATASHLVAEGEVAAWTVSDLTEEPGMEVPLDGKVVTPAAGTSVYKFLHFAQADTAISAADGVIRLVGQHDSQATGTQVGVVARNSPGTSQRYYLHVHGTSLDVSLGRGTAAQTGMSLALGTAKAQDNKWYGIELAVLGSTLIAKFYDFPNYTTPVWTATVKDTTFSTAGSWGAMAFSSVLNRAIDWMGVATEGAALPAWPSAVTLVTLTETVPLAEVVTPAIALPGAAGGRRIVMLDD